MTERINRKDQIIEAATDLFMRHGYNATSVRQIADAVGCTEAALYYHFKEGKRTLFLTVVEQNLPNFLEPVKLCRSAQSLTEVIQCLSTSLSSSGSENRRRLRWLLAEFATLGPDEQALIRDKFMAYHGELSQIIAGFAPEASSALAWLLICVISGYEQVLYPLHLPSEVVTRADVFAALLHHLH